MGGTNVTKKKKTTAKKTTKTANTRSARTAPKKNARAGSRTAKPKPLGKTTSRKPARAEKTARSTASAPKPRSPAPKARAKHNTPETDDGTEPYRPMVIRKTKLSAEDLDHFRNLLLDKRRELSGTVNQLSNEAFHKSRKDAAGDLSSMPIHMADLGSDNWEQEFTLGLLENENQLLREIDDALLRIQNKTYGICMGTNKRIQKTRLRAKPWAKYCIAYAREIELRKGT